MAQNGKVLWFNDTKGFGFIRGEDDKDYFVHFKSIQSGDHRKTLQETQSVSFVAEKTPKGMAATDVKVI